MKRAEAFAIAFPQYKRPPGLLDTSSPAHVPPKATYATLIEATTCFVVTPDGRDFDAIQEAFDQCTERLSIFIDAYAQTSGDLQAGFVNRLTTTQFVPMIIFNPEDETTQVTGFHANDSPTHRTASPPDLTDQQLDEVRSRFRMALLGEPYVTVWQWQRVAYRALHIDGDFAAAVIACHTAGEVFFDALLLRLAWEEITFDPGSTTTEEQVGEWFRSNKSGLGYRMGNLYNNRLRGIWAGGKPISDWKPNVSVIRNRIVHGGYRPTQAEAIRALTTLQAIESYVLDLVAQDPNRARYPRTTYMMLGQRGLEERGLYKGQLRRTLEGTSPDWLEEFYRFRRKVVAAVSGE
jgi:hypothetical protein